MTSLDIFHLKNYLNNYDTKDGYNLTYSEEQNKVRVFNFMKQMSTFQLAQTEVKNAAMILTLIVKIT